MKDLWPGTTCSNPMKENTSIEIIREQARILGKKSDNRVKASFTKIQYKSPYSDAVANLSDFFTTANIPQSKEILDDELKDKVDLKDLLQEQSYKFEIYNSVYRFRLFRYYYSPAYPNKIVFDENVALELGYSSETEVSSNSNLEMILSRAFSSSRVQQIVSIMMGQETDKSNDKKE